MRFSGSTCLSRGGPGSIPSVVKKVRMWWGLMSEKLFSHSSFPSWHFSCKFEVLEASEKESNSRILQRGSLFIREVKKHLGGEATASTKPFLSLGARL